ncbi:MAG: DNA polymerase III subunit gamma/tau [Alphaproteobacteria bacterium]|nr:DNA polymerase III subunit gamma/tau [Alphaproteobacteria bacterium]
MSQLFALDEPATDAPAAYRVLARKYRPTTFEQLIGQEAMVRTLSNAITAGRLPHAWMLTGVRGIGKTTTARIIARALNCTGPDGKGGPTIHPCGQCDACRTIMEDRNVDVMEMDAASRTGVDDMREIIDGVRYGPVAGRYKIYILDEVHMLSKNAFNALLKTLEEPPPHTKFIFATTEIRKVPVTVLSRCQRFDLRRIDSAVLAPFFTKIAEMEGAKAEPEAVKLIANAADGSARDGLSLLDQAIARGNGTIAALDVKDMLGLADRGQSLSLCRQLLRGEMKAALDGFAAMQQAGSDPLQVLQDMCDLVHLLTRGQVIPEFANDPALAEYDRQLLTDLSDIKIPALARAWQILLKGVSEVQSASHPAQAAEMVLIRLAYASDLPSPADLVKQLKDSVASGSAPASAPPSGGGGGSRAKMALGGGGGVVAQTVTEAVAVVGPQPQNFREIVALFSEHREAGLHAQLYGQVHFVACAGGNLEIRVGSGAPANLAGRVGQCLTEWTGQRWVVSISAAEGEATLADQDRAAEKERHERARAHPLMQAVIKSFPDAKLVALKQRNVAPVAASSEDDAPQIENISPEIED